MPTVTLRVHNLAKELGVPSKAIIDKCRDEGIELKNHMAVISVGLSESIREWFSVGADVTSVEEAAPVDLTKIRRPRKRKSAEPTPEAPAVEPPPAPETALAEPPAVEVPPAPEAPLPAVVPPVEAPAPAVVEMPAVVPPPPPVPPEVERLVAQAPVEAAPAPEIVAPPPEAGAGVLPTLEPPPPPEPVRPAGEQLVPAPAKLVGPRIVGWSTPEPVYPPRRGPVGPRPLGAPTGGATTTTTPDTAAPRRGRAKNRKQAEEEAARRARSPRRHGGTTEVDQRMREWRDQDLLERKERLASVTGTGLRDRRAAERRRQATHPGVATTARKDPIALIAPIAIKDFCAAVGVPFQVVSRKLMETTGRLWTINQSMEADLTELIATELEVPVELQRARTAYEQLRDTFAERERHNLQPRPPVVAMLGHVDHGKTSLLDAIRQAHVAAGEAGGITQHIGAYRVDRGEWHVTFVDTPGHEAFTAMRARGADLTDVVVLVVAADDGVMPQTVEAINHAKAARVPIVVALNKIDIPGIDVNRVFSQLSEHELAPSEWGGTTDVIRTSATTGEGIDALVAHLSTLSDLLDLKADPDVPAYATVVEAAMEEGQGIVARVLVREGTLKPGQTIVCGPGAGRIRALLGDRGETLKSAGPGTPVAVSGLDELPSAGDALYEVDSLARAKEIAEEVRQQRRSEALQSAAPKARTLEELIRGAEAEVPELNVILRADVQGSVEVLKKSLAAFPAEKARLNILQAAVGAVSEADVNLAKTSGALVIGFHVVPEERARVLAEQLGVEVRLYRVIYEILDDLHKALAGLLAPEEKEEIRATVEVRQIFRVSRVGTIAGCMVTDGAVHRNHKVRLVRDGRIVLERAAIASLKRFKDDAREVRAGLECGIKLDGFDDVKPGDVLQAFEVVEVSQAL